MMDNNLNYYGAPIIVCEFDLEVYAGSPLSADITGAGAGLLDPLVIDPLVED
jgi:hypothetical protein